MSKQKVSASNINELQLADEVPDYFFRHWHESKPKGEESIASPALIQNLKKIEFCI